MAKRSHLPLVYACSGCSSAAQLANHLALRLDREGFAEMSCIAGVGGDVAPLVRTAASGRPIIAIDGCPLACARSTLARHCIEPAAHYDLASAGIRKRLQEDFDPAAAASLFPVLASRAATLASPSGKGVSNEP